MEANSHRLIADLAVSYAGRMSDGDKDCAFSRHDIAAAYILGGETTLNRVCNVIRESAYISGLSDRQAATLLRIIEAIECRPEHHDNE